MNARWRLTAVTSASVLGFLVALFVAANVPTDLLYPERCMPSSLLGNFCIKYDSAIGRYELPPPEIPADVSRMNPWDEEHATTVRWIAGATTFGLITFGAWLLTGGAPSGAPPRAGPARRSRDIQRR
jgi:hypothetical protein